MSYEYRCCSREIGFRIEVERFLAKDMEVWGWQLNLRLFEAATSNPSSNFIFFLLLLLFSTFQGVGGNLPLNVLGVAKSKTAK